jgi:hypothetical protein
MAFDLQPVSLCLYVHRQVALQDLKSFHQPLEQGMPEVITPANMDYQFVKARGAGVYEVPVGPIHAGIFRLLNVINHYIFLPVALPF